MAVARKQYDAARSPDQLGLDPAITLRVWINPPMQVYLNLYDQGETRAKAFHALFGTSEPQTVEVEGDDGTTTSIVLDFRTVEAARQTIERTDLPLDIANWLADLPSGAIRYRREMISELLPQSFGQATR